MAFFGTCCRRGPFSVCIIDGKNIDPPYNTGSAFEHYDDNLEHSTWLSLMVPRLRILRNLMSNDGSIWISIDDEERDYLKVICDEIFARKEKIKLETCIQAAYFDRIIARANIRLLQMSNSQFELKRRDISGKQGQSGLDLNVIDHYNDTERDAKTLSGGEPFIASLSLALGLSDEIQNNAGGIRLDSMFVDEGFDSLSETKLSQVIQALTSISQTNRLIGIISHVAGLDEKIGRKIVVTKDRTGGSRAEIILN